jgi:hypothetical protein
VLSLPKIPSESRRSAAIRRWIIQIERCLWFYEIRGFNYALLKRDGGFATQDAAKTAGRMDAKNMKNSSSLGVPNVGTVMVGQNKEAATRY